MPTAGTVSSGERCFLSAVGTVRHVDLIPGRVYQRSNLKAKEHLPRLPASCVNDFIVSLRQAMGVEDLPEPYYNVSDYEDETENKRSEDACNTCENRR